MHRSAYLCLAGAVLPQLGSSLPDARADTTRVDTTRVIYVRGGIPENYTGPLGNRSTTLTEFIQTKTIPYGLGYVVHLRQSTLLLLHMAASKLLL